MDEKEKKRLAELRAKENKTDEENTELEQLEEKYETEVQSAAFAKALKDSGVFAVGNDTIKKLIAESKANPVGEDARDNLIATDKNMQLSALCTAIKQKDQEAINHIKAITEGMTEGTSADGGYLVPALTDASIFEFVKTSGQALKLCTVMPMKGNVLNLPRYNGSIAGGWINEASAITPEKGTLTVDTLTPKKWAGLIPLSSELFEDANPSIGAFLTKVLGQAEAYALDGKVFQNGNTTLTGVFYASNTFGGTTTTSGTNPNTLLFSDLVSATLAVDPNFNPNPQWYMSPSILALVLSLKDQNNRPIYDYNLRTILGYPVNTILQAPTSADVASKPIIIFGDLNNSVVGDVNQRRINILTEGSITINGSYVSLAENDMIAIRSIKSYAFAPRSNGYSLIKTHA